jgi:hypothetical protein
MRQLLLNCLPSFKPPGIIASARSFGSDSQEGMSICRQYVLSSTKPSCRNGRHWLALHGSLVMRHGRCVIYHDVIERRETPRRLLSLPQVADIDEPAGAPRKYRVAVGAQWATLGPQMSRGRHGGLRPLTPALIAVAGSARTPVLQQAVAHKCDSLFLNTSGDSRRHKRTMRRCHGASARIRQSRGGGGSLCALRYSPVRYAVPAERCRALVSDPRRPA